ncbi:MAG: enoyl-CoA hydratase/isomerase family protein [Gammaproteobacteria bacterium]|nr:enoyl-CoA hydratase/isomerase family protein [Gammaproteobacteria bacterium]
MIRSELQGAVRVLTLERPEVLNAFNTEQFELLAKTLLAADADSSTKVVVLTGAGRAFSAGADLAENRPPPEDLEYGFQGCIDILVDFRKPLILAINGVGVGIGATICGLADMVYMAESARLRCPFSALGLTAEACSTYTFPRLMGPQGAADFLLGAGWLSAAQCKASGLALEIFPHEGFLERVMQEAQNLAGLPLASLLQTKKLLMAPHVEAMKAANVAENEALLGLRGGPANTEAVTAFREKREPDFSDSDILRDNSR